MQKQEQQPHGMIETVKYFESCGHADSERLSRDGLDVYHGCINAGQASYILAGMVGVTRTIGALKKNKRKKTNKNQQ